MKQIIEQFLDNRWQRVPGSEILENEEEAQDAIDELRLDPVFTMAQLRVSVWRWSKTS